MRAELTASQLKVFNFVDAFIRENQIGPSLKEICAACGWTSENSAVEQMQRLERKGYITRGRSTVRNKPRFIRIVKRPDAKASTKRRAA